MSFYNTCRWLVKCVNEYHVYVHFFNISQLFSNKNNICVLEWPFLWKVPNQFCFAWVCRLVSYSINPWSVLIRSHHIAWKISIWTTKYLNHHFHLFRRVYPEGCELWSPFPSVDCAVQCVYQKWGFIAFSGISVSYGYCYFSVKGVASHFM